MDPSLRSTATSWPPPSPESMLALARALKPSRSLILSRHNRQDLEQLIPREWMKDARCGSSDPEAWTLGVGVRPSSQALRVCGDCPARQACLAAAVLHSEDGVWAAQRTTCATRRATLSPLVPRRRRASRSCSTRLESTRRPRPATLRVSERG
jgi:Transcription factor WhiB